MTQELIKPPSLESVRRYYERTQSEFYGIYNNDKAYDSFENHFAVSRFLKSSQMLLNLVCRGDSWHSSDNQLGFNKNDKSVVFQMNTSNCSGFVSVIKQEDGTFAYSALTVNSTDENRTSDEKRLLRLVSEIVEKATKIE